MPTKTSRLAGDPATGKYLDRKAAGERWVPRRPLLALTVKAARAVRWMMHRMAYGFGSNPVGRYALGSAAVYLAASSVWGLPWVYHLGTWTLGLLAAALFWGAFLWRRRERWEERVEDIVRHNVPGHSIRTPERVWFGRGDIHRWTGSFDFGFAVPPILQQVDLEAATERLRARLPAEDDFSWMVNWNLRRSRAQATLVENMPHKITLAQLRARVRAMTVAANTGDVALDRDRIPLGVSVDGPEFYDVEENPHLFVTGSTGKGKSVALMVLLAHCLERRDSWEVSVCDPKRVEFSFLKGRPGVISITRDLESMVSTIQAAEAEMRARYERMDAAGVNHIRDLDSNAKRRLLLVDELTQIGVREGGKDDETKYRDGLRDDAMFSLQEIAALGRAAGVHLCLATQRPDVSNRTVTGQLKANVTGRLAVGRMDKIASTMSLDTDAAAQLPESPKGAAIWAGNHGSKRIQTAFATKKELPKAKASTRG